MTTSNNTENVEIEHRRQEVQQAIDNACDQMRSEGVHPRDYVEQLSWLFFLKAFEESETRREQEAAFDGLPHRRLLDEEYRWTSWAKRTDRPDEMLAFVNGKLWPRLTNLNNGPIGLRFNRIFSSIKNHQSRGPSFGRVVAQVDRLHFSDRTDVVVLSEIYEKLLKDVAQVSGYAGEFYTPRHIIRAMVRVVKPTIADRVYDPCFGSAGFLSEAANAIRREAGTLSAAELDKFHKRTFFGREMVPLAYLMGTMGLLLHDVHDPVLELVNTLEGHTPNVAEQDKYSVILANPPYGGKLASQLQTNFTVRSGSTEVLFLQHVMANLARSGRAAVVVPEGVLFRGGPDAKVRERLLSEFNVHTILSLPAGCFLPYAGVKTNVIFFKREADGRGTDHIWFYELNNDGFELKTTRKRVGGDEFPDFVEKQPQRSTTDRSWMVKVSELKGFDLSAKNPRRSDDVEGRTALELVQSIKVKHERISELLNELEQILEA